jgi:peptidoglycan/xylan/chitin deacetylase (PgdA/CDA1 family)
MKPVLMIHEFKEEYLDLPLEQYILTFDDGLYSQYLFINELQKINTQKIFFISSDIVCPEQEIQDSSFISCVDAHNSAFAGRLEHYIKWSQIRLINEMPNCIVGCHSHSHIYNIVSDTQTMIRDTREMTKIFKIQLGHLPQHFCFPYNIESQVYRGILHSYGFRYFYGSERIDIDSL